MRESYAQIAEILGIPSHYHPRSSSAVWKEKPEGWLSDLETAVRRGRAGEGRPAIFFRADDIGAGGKPFEALCRLFRHHGIPLGMAVVPAWLNDGRCDRLFETAGLDEPLWGWHQHGWRHVNWQRLGKKSEFGEQRPIDRQTRDIAQGRDKMRKTFGDRFLPIFTPPWDRISSTTLMVLQQLEFKAVSMENRLPRSTNHRPALKHLKIHLDLHTRKDGDPIADYQSLMGEIAGLMTKRDPAGIVIHHQHMTLFAFEFLHEFLSLLKEGMRARFPGFGDLIQENSIV